MKARELRGMKTAELHAELEQLRHHLFDLHTQAVTEKLENPHQIKGTQVVIARVLTILRERGETRIEEEQRHRRAMMAKQT